MKKYEALKIVSVIGLIWSLRVISMDVVPMETSSSAPDIIPMETSSSAPAGTPAPSESQTLQEMAQRGSQQFPSALPRELVGMVDEYFYMPQIINEIINAIESAPNLGKALNNIDTLSPDVLDKANKDVGRMLKEKFRDQIDLADSGGWTPLISVAYRGYEKNVKALLAAGADIKKATINGATPLFVAAERGHEKVVQELLNKGADKDKANNDGATPLFIAAANGHEKVVQELLNKGADKDKANNDGATPLFVAAYRGHEKVVQELLNKGADKDKAENDGATPLFAAAANGREKIVQMLLSKGADKSLTWHGMTPLQIAKRIGHTAIVKMLE